MWRRGGRTKRGGCGKEGTYISGFHGDAGGAFGAAATAVPTIAAIMHFFIVEKLLSW